MSLREDLNAKIKQAMLAHEKARLNALRLLLSEVKKVEVDQRITLDDSQIIAIVTKMVKQREDSAAQYASAGRPELADGENFEATVLQEFLPAALSDEEVSALIVKAIAETGAQVMTDMSKVMAFIKPLATGRTDMGSLSKKVREALNK
jgi:uncharacterized protein